jgi:hypothetical protein
MVGWEYRVGGPKVRLQPAESGFRSLLGTRGRGKSGPRDDWDNDADP